MSTRDAMDTTLLIALACCPFLPLADLEALCDDAPTSTVHRAITRLMAASLVERVPLGRDKAHGYCLTGDGVIALATAADRAPDEVCTTYGLGRRQLLARLPLLDHLGGAQWLLTDLRRALLQSGRGELPAYTGGPVRWRTYPEGIPAVATLDGQGAIQTPGAQAPLHFGLLLDDDERTPVTALRYRLVHLRAVRADPARLLPPVLLVTPAPERVAQSQSVMPAATLWTTAAEIDERGVLAARWVLPRHGDAGSPPPSRPLLEALEALPAAAHAPWSFTARPASPARAGSRLGLEERLAALRRGRVERRPTPPGLLAAALPPRQLAVLDVLGRFPLLQPAQIAEVCAQDASRVRATLALLRRHDLASVHHLVDETIRPIGRYALTGRGLHLLAARAGLPLPVYRRLYDTLEDSPWGRHHGLTFALGNAAHTRAVQSVFLAFVRAARRRNGTLTWRGEWACVRAWEDAWDEERRLVRPDAEVFYGDDEQHLALFVELDRSTKTQGDLAAQLAGYHDLAAALPDERTVDVDRREHVRRPTLTVAVIATESRERARNILRTAERVAAERRSTQVRVCVTSLPELLRSGDPLGRTWRTGPHAELAFLSARLTLLTRRAAMYPRSST